MNTLQDLGWTAFFEQQLSDEDRAQLTIARVIEEQKERYIVATESGEGPAEVSGRLRHNARGREDFPAVGDWVLVQGTQGGSAAIHRVLERLTKLSRKVAGRTQDEQILAANVDLVFITTSLNQDLNPRRIERTLTLVAESGALPVVLLTKADLCADSTKRVKEIEAIARGISVLAVCALEEGQGRVGRGMQELRGYLSHGQTAVLLGSSGVGKSTLVNALLGHEALATQSVRADDDRGRHTTTHRQLLRIPGGGLLIDTPGVREIQLWADEDSLEETFDDIARLALQCRFKNCGHATEPGCAIQEAIQQGTLPVERWSNYVKMKNELAYFERRGNKAAESEQKKKWRSIHRMTHNHIKDKRRIQM